MSASCGYLIPDKSFSLGEFTKAIRTILEQQKVLKGYYDKEQGRLAAGENSFLIFSDNLNNSPIAFEYADIHDTINNRLMFRQVIQRVKEIFVNIFFTVFTACSVTL